MKAAFEKKDTTKITLHLETTSRTRIDGDWPCLILNFLDPDPLLCQMVTLRPLLFAYEDRDQITLFFTETLRRLQVAADGKMDQS